MSLAPTEDHYSATIIYTQYPFGKKIYIMGTSPTRNGAYLICLHKAEELNWKRPSKWQWWRRKDSSAPYINVCL
jgi:hypothetical protein